MSASPVKHVGSDEELTGTGDVPSYAIVADSRSRSTRVLGMASATYQAAAEARERRKGPAAGAAGGRRQVVGGIIARQFALRDPALAGAPILRDSYSQDAGAARGR